MARVGSKLTLKVGFFELFSIWDPFSSDLCGDLLLCRLALLT